MAASMCTRCTKRFIAHADEARQTSWWIPFPERDERNQRLKHRIKDEFDAFLDCGSLTRGFLRLRCGECGHDKLLAFSCKRRGFCPSCGARRMQPPHPVPGTAATCGCG